MLPADEPTGGSCYVGEPLPWACMRCEVTLHISHGQVCGGSWPVLSSTRKCHHGRGRTSMHPSVLLMVCLLTLYVVTMVMFWHGIAGQPPAARLETAGRLALQTGQTIVGVVETAQGLAFAIGEYVRDEKYEEG
jgi:hypothetical protein